MREFLAGLVTQGGRSPTRTYEPGDGAIHRGPRRLVIAAVWLCKWFFHREESLACQADTLQITR